MPSRSVESTLVSGVLGCIPEPPVDLFKLAESLGIRDFRATPYPNGFTDFRFQEPVVFLNRTESGNRMRYVLAHELAHVILRTHRGAYELSRYRRAGLLGSEEDAADSVAAALLLPDSWVEVLREARCTLTGLESVACQVGMPISALVRRLSRAKINVALLQWRKANRRWRVTDRPGAPPYLHGDLVLSSAASRRFERLPSHESIVLADCSVDGEYLVVEGPAKRLADEVRMLIEPSPEIWSPWRPRLSAAGAPVHAKAPAADNRHGRVTAYETRPSDACRTERRGTTPAFTPPTDTFSDESHLSVMSGTSPPTFQDGN